MAPLFRSVKASNSCFTQTGLLLLRFIISSFIFSIAEAATHGSTGLFCCLLVFVLMGFFLNTDSLSVLAGCENIFTCKTLKFKFGLKLQTSRCISLNSERCGGMGVTDAVRQTHFFPQKYEAY